VTNSGATGTEVRRFLLPALVYLGFVASIISTIGPVLIPTLAPARNVSLETAQWMLTGTLLVGAVSLLLIGRLAEGPRQRPVILATLAIMFVGSVLAAMAPNFPLLLTGRLLQGLGPSLVPLAIGIAREQLPSPRRRSGIAAISATAAAGAGLGFPVAGLIGETFWNQAVFWLAAVLTAFALPIAWLTIPGKRDAAARPLDVSGLALVSISMTSLLLAISVGGRWGTTRAIGVSIAAAVTGVLWVVHEVRNRHPLVKRGFLARRTLLAANLASMLMGVAIYAMLSLVNRYLQTPASAGHGFETSMVAVGLVLALFSAGGIATSRFSIPMERRFGPGKVVAGGALLVGLDLMALALERDAIWHVALAMLVLGAGTGLAFAMMPALIMSSVPAEETGRATELNQVLRLVGGSIGSAASIAIIGGHPQVNRVYLVAERYTLAFAAGAVACLAAAIACLVLIRQTSLAHEVSVGLPAGPAARSALASIRRTTPAE